MCSTRLLNEINITLPNTSPIGLSGKSVNYRSVRNICELKFWLSWFVVNLSWNKIKAYMRGPVCSLVLVLLCPTIQLEILKRNPLPHVTHLQLCHEGTRMSGCGLRSARRFHGLWLMMQNCFWGDFKQQILTVKGRSFITQPVTMCYVPSFIFNMKCSFMRNNKVRVVMKKPLARIPKSVILMRLVL